jgi:hypothetical protein
MHWQFAIETLGPIYLGILAIPLSSFAIAQFCLWLWREDIVDMGPLGIGLAVIGILVGIICVIVFFVFAYFGP